MKKVIMAAVVFVLAISPVCADGKLVRNLVVGAVGGIAVDLFLAVNMLSSEYIANDETVTVKGQIAAYIPAAIVGMATSLAAANGYFNTVEDTSEEWWEMMLFGGITGAATTAVVGGLSVATAIGAEAAVYSRVDWRSMGSGIAFGGSFGLPVGFLTGTVTGLLLHLYQ